MKEKKDTNQESSLVAQAHGIGSDCHVNPTLSALISLVNVFQITASKKIKAYFNKNGIECWQKESILSCFVAYNGLLCKVPSGQNQQQK